MKIIYYSKSGYHTDAMKEATEKKFKKLEKFLKDDEPVKVTYETFKKDQIKVKAQIVLKNNRRVRAEVNGYDYYDLVTDIVDNLKEQAKASKEKTTYKERIEKEEILTEEPSMVPVIKKIKRFDVEKMTEGMAALAMEKLGHDNFIFRNINEDDKLCCLYRRLDGDYSMIVVEH